MRDGWTAKALSEMIIPSGTINPRKNPDQTFHYVDVSSVSNVTHEITEAPAGNIGVIPEGEQVCLGQRTVLIRPKKDIVKSYYLAYLILHPLTQKRLLAHSTGATVQHVNMKDIRRLPIGNLPSLREQLADVQVIGEARTNFNELETIYQQKLTALTELKQSILQKAFAGEIT